MGRAGSVPWAEGNMATEITCCVSRLALGQVTQTDVPGFDLPMVSAVKRYRLFAKLNVVGARLLNHAYVRSAAE